MSELLFFGIGLVVGAALFIPVRAGVRWMTGGKLFGDDAKNPPTTGA